MTSTPSHLPAAAAVASSGADAPVAWHYGDPLGEQRTLRSGTGLIDRSSRDVLQVSGADRLSWLHSICSQHVSSLGDGSSTEALVLSPHGHVEQHWQLTELAGTTWIDTEPGAAPTVLAYLQKMRFMKRVEPVDVSAGWAVLTLAGPTTSAVLVAAGLPTVTAGHAKALGDGSTGSDSGAGLVRARDGASGVETDVIVARPDAPQLSRRLLAAGAAPVGVWAYEALRVEARVARLGLETDHRTIPHEVGWIGRAVHLDKGCYRGQETVARVHNLGRPPRRLVLLHLSGDSDELPEAGAPVTLDGRTIGFLGTAVHHHELGPVALAVIKRTTVEGTTVSVGGTPATVD